MPGIITSSNCRDFRTDPQRRRRIRHFVQKVKRAGDGPRWTWVRGSALPRHTLFAATPPRAASVDARNVVQGAVGNCGFCSGFASVAAVNVDVVVDAFGRHSGAALAECGAVSVRLFPYGVPRYLLLDDYVLSCAHAKRDVGGIVSPSMHSVLPGELWVRLLEKAFVKVQGSYASLDGYYKYNSLYRHPARALQLLTGAQVALEVRYAPSDVDTVFQILAVATQGSYARVVHCRKRIDGLVCNHGYSLLWAGAGPGGVRLACLRNPHGKGSYTGRFGFGCTAELESALCGLPKNGAAMPKCFGKCPTTGSMVWQPREDGGLHPAFRLRDQNHDDGIFFMEFSTFVECFPIATLVGPVDLEATDAMSEISSAVPFGGQYSDVVHTVTREKLTHVIEIIDAARVSGHESRA